MNVTLAKLNLDLGAEMYASVITSYSIHYTKLYDVSFHSARWQHEHDLTGKRVGVIGTGATSVQIVPHLGEWAEHLYVFQRTPSSVDVKNNPPTVV